MNLYLFVYDCMYKDLLVYVCILLYMTVCFCSVRIDAYDEGRLPEFSVLVRNFQHHLFAPGELPKRSRKSSLFRCYKEQGGQEALLQLRPRQQLHSIRLQRTTIHPLVLLALVEGRSALRRIQQGNRRGIHRGRNCPTQCAMPSILAISDADIRMCCNI